MSSALVLFRYVGPGGEFFPDFHWAPAPGEERELPEETNSPLLERVRPDRKHSSKESR